MAERLYADDRHPNVLAMRASVLDAEAKAGEIGCQMRADPDYDEWAQTAIALILAGADEHSGAQPDSEDDSRFDGDGDRPPTGDETRRFAIRATERLAMYLAMDAPDELVDGEVRRLCQLCGVDPSRPMAMNFAASSN
ncbi:MAG TPA: hypothetical protein PK640_07935 [Verrucomicrobiota bacterium]|nr:hypothetical protein [Verrucomicrobiota bacterium]